MSLMMPVNMALRLAHILDLLERGRRPAGALQGRGRANWGQRCRYSHGGRPASGQMASVVDAAAASADFEGGPHPGCDGALAEGLAVDVHVHRFATNQQFAVAGAAQLEA